jgi:hypothetical protein
MKKTRAHLRIEWDLSTQAKKIAERRRVTFTAIVEEGLRLVVQKEKLERERAMDAEQI